MAFHSTVHFHLHPRYSLIPTPTEIILVFAVCSKIIKSAQVKATRSTWNNQVPDSMVQNQIDDRGGKKSNHSNQFQLKLLINYLLLVCSHYYFTVDNLQRLCLLCNNQHLPNQQRYNIVRVAKYLLIQRSIINHLKNFVFSA